MRNGKYPTLAVINSYDNVYEYNLGYVIVEYIVKKWGMPEVVNLIRENGDIQKVLNITTEEFEQGCYKYIEEQYLKK